VDCTTPKFPIVEVLEHVLPTLIPEYELEICDCDEMGVNHGLTYPEDSRIKLREDIYDRACEGEGRDRMTLAHELGHLLLHRNVGFARIDRDATVPSYMDSEWQANCFGGELLMCARHVHRCKSASEAERLFGVSSQAASTQWEAYKRDGIIKG
jgi:Zn-dependent peptidase ImmA (M78 family)